MDDLPLNVMDMVVLAIVLISGVLALLRGFVRELLSTGAWVGAAVVAYFAFPSAEPFVRDYIDIPLVAALVTGAALFLISLVVLSILTEWIVRGVRATALGGLDRPVGLLFGVLRGALLVCLAWLLFTYVVPPEDHPPWITEARTLPLVDRGAGWLRGLAPETLTPAGPTRTGQPDNAWRAPVGQPTAKAAGASNGKPRQGYGTAERQDLERLLRTID